MPFVLPHDLTDRYRLIHLLGEGGFAETYLAIDQEHAQTVAIKILRARLSVDHDMAARFAREARATAKIQHPNVVAVFDHGEADGNLFTVMELVDGPDLKQEIQSKKHIAVDEACRILDEVLAGLGAIHEVGIVHRDVKPENILLSASGTPKLSDFGIARTATSTGLTATGVTLGTASYMAPEQATGEHLGPPADLYAAGAVLFEMLTGQVPFPGDNPLQVMFQHVHQSPPRPTEINPEIPAALSAVVLRALAKDPERRFQSAAAMQQALAASATAAAPTTTAFVPVSVPVPAPVAAAMPARAVRPAAPTSRRRWLPSAALRWPVAAMGIVILLAITAVVMLAARGGGTAASSDVAPREAAAMAASPVAIFELMPTATRTPSPTPTPTAATQIATEQPVSPTEHEPTVAEAEDEQATSQPAQQQSVFVEPTPTPATAPPAASQRQILPAITSSSDPIQAEPDDERDRPKKDQKQKDDKSGKNQGQGQSQGNKGKD